MQVVVLFGVPRGALIMGGSRGGAGGPTPTEKSQKIGFPSNIDPDPLKFTNLPSQHSIVGHYRHASETPFPKALLGLSSLGPILWQYFLSYAYILKIKRMKHAPHQRYR